MDIIKRIREALKIDKVTSKEKKEVEKLYGELESDEKAVIKGDYQKFMKLKEVEEEEKEENPAKTPEENSGTSGDDEEDDENLEETQKMIKILIRKETQGLGKEVEDSITKKVNEYLKDHREQAEKKVGVYQDDIAERRKKLNNKVRAYANALLGGDDSKVKEMTTDATGTPYAGYIVDSELRAEIAHLITQYGVARREMMATQLSKNSIDQNDLQTDLTVYWVDEGSNINSSQVVLGQNSLELKKLATIVTLTNELLEDQEIDLVGFIAERVAEGFAQKEDEAFFKGDGTSSYGSFTGLLNNANLNEVTMAGHTFGSVDADDLIDMVDATPQGALNNGKYFLHRTIMSYIRKLKNSDNEYIYQAPSERGPATIWGYPVVFVEAMPDKNDSAVDTSFVLFGDMKKAALFGYKGAIKVERSNSAVVRNVADSGDINTFKTDRQAIRWIERVGYVVIIPTAITKLTTAASSA